MLQYQILTLMTTNGQTPFVSVCMYLGEVSDPQTKADLAKIIEEVLKQRIQGVKNEVGAWITPAFPKLLYVLEEDNIREDSKYYYLTKIAAECTAKRMVPDYISEKIMLEKKIDKNGEGHAYPCMGSVDRTEVVTYKIDDNLFVESFDRMWRRLKSLNKIEYQNTQGDMFIRLNNTTIWDNKQNKFVKCLCITKNKAQKWIRVNLNHRSVIATHDHKFETENRGELFGYELQPGDKILIDKKQYSEERIKYDPEKAWTLGMILCDGCYATSSIVLSIAAHDEDDIQDRYIKNMSKFFGFNPIVKNRDRGPKGIYKDIICNNENPGFVISVSDYLCKKFEGIQKINRHIPTEAFLWNKEAKLAFIAGMIDADGYIKPNDGLASLGSTNRELALQQMKLLQSVGIECKSIDNYYKGHQYSKNIRYAIEFYPTQELIDMLTCEKKKKNFIPGKQFINFEDIDEVKEINPILNDSIWSYDVTTESGHFEVSGIYSHNCRSFLTPYIDENGKPKYYGRFNQGVVTINLPDVALSSEKDEEKFWQIFEERLELCYKALMCRHRRLEGTPSDIAPLFWQYGAIGRLKIGEPIDKLLHGGYSTISLGYAGLYECVLYMKGVSHTDPDGKEFAIKVMQKLNDKCKEWKEKENIDFSVYGTPIESTTYTFAKALKKRFGVIPGITDKNWITNSFH